MKSLEATHDATIGEFREKKPPPYLLGDIFRCTTVYRYIQPALGSPPLLRFYSHPVPHRGGPCFRRKTTPLSFPKGHFLRNLRNPHPQTRVFCKKRRPGRPPHIRDIAARARWGVSFIIYVKPPPPSVWSWNFSENDRRLRGWKAGSPSSCCAHVHLRESRPAREFFIFRPRLRWYCEPIGAQIELIEMVIYWVEEFAMKLCTYFVVCSREKKI